MLPASDRLASVCSRRGTGLARSRPRRPARRRLVLARSSRDGSALGCGRLRSCLPGQVVECVGDGVGEQVIATVSQQGPLTARVCAGELVGQDGEQQRLVGGVGTVLLRHLAQRHVPARLILGHGEQCLGHRYVGGGFKQFRVSR